VTEATNEPTRDVVARIDAHFHLWDLDVRPQGWTADLPVIDRTFTFDELAPQLDPVGVVGAILVETVNLPEETAELLALAAKTPQVRGVVGWVDLTAPDVADQIADLQALPGGDRLVGLRHQVQRETDPRWLARPDVLAGLAAVADSGLVFELLVLHDQLPAAVEAARATPAGRFLLTHLGKPPISSGVVEPWATQVRELAASPNVACKLSGMVTEASPEWTVADLRPYAAHVLDVFGPDRVMAGSDWPVCLLRTDYAGVWAANDWLLSELSADDLQAVHSGTATTWYGLS
jgi:L-fuconolactonase